MNQSKPHGRKEASDNKPLLPLLTIADVCSMFQISRPTIYTLIDQGLPVIRFGKAIRFSSGSVQRWVTQREEIA
jgi:excisionase family DNA binding protein